MIYHFEKDWNITQSFRGVDELCGTCGTISKTQVERWNKKFKSGDTNLVGAFGSRERGRLHDNHCLSS